MHSDRQSVETHEHESNLVLVVDDSRLQRSILRASLKKWGYRVAEVSSGDEALAFCEITQPDLVISDWMMPGMDGIEFCRRFKGLKSERFGYFILLTSKSDKTEIAQGLDAGADDFLTKPVSAAELRARLVAGERILTMERELTRKNELINTTLDELKTLYTIIDNDLIEAKQLQQSLVRERFKDFGAAQISLMLQSSGHVGGDLVGYFPINEHEIGLFAIDVSGHGISSALMTARLAGYMSSASKEQNIAIERRAEGIFVPIAPSEVVARLNDLVLREMTTEHYFTLVYATVDLSTGKVTVSQAGHPHPLVQRADGSVELVGRGGLPVGLMADASYDQFELQLAAGDRLLVLSDGVSECMNEADEFYDDENIVRFMNNWRGKRGPCLLDALLFELDSFAGARDFSDDISAILLEFASQET